MAIQSVFKRFVDEMTDEALAEYAERCLTTPGYLRDQLARGYKVPRRDLMVRLVSESGGAVCRDDLMAHFYPRSDFGSAA